MVLQSLQGKIYHVENDVCERTDTQTPDCTIKTSFSFRKLWAFSGPGLLMSIAFLDPGNIEADLQAGNATKYKLLWVFLWSTILGLVMQRLAARLGVVTGQHLSELCYQRYPVFPRILLWLMMEVAIVGSDMQEVIGTAIAFFLISNKTIPLYGGVLITVVDTFFFLMLDKFGVRKLEFLFAVLIVMMAGTFGYEYVVVFPEQERLMEGMVIPWCEGCDRKAVLMAVGVIGATIMPHNLYLHSALVKSRAVDKTDREAVREANKYYFIESTIALAISLMINVFVVTVFADGLYGRTNRDVLEVCMKTNIPDRDIFPNNTDPVDPDMYIAGIFLGCQFGLAPMYIWALGLYASGQSSTMTGTYSGQFVMEGFLQLKWARWKRVLVTRSIAILPTVMVAAFQGIANLTNMNDLLNVLMSIQLPFALLPTIAFTSSRHVMSEFCNSVFMVVLTFLLAVGIMAINLYFVYDLTFQITDSAAFMALGAFLLFYVLFVLYLFAHCLSTLGFKKLNRLPLIGPFLAEPEDSSPNSQQLVNGTT